jgi:hypothetical protein
MMNPVLLALLAGIAVSVLAFLVVWAACHVGKRAERNGER